MLEKSTVDYLLGDSGEFIIENYNSAKPFSSFFPGIAGTDGIPMWVFYVNRGQCICSMGLENKQKPIMEFLSANRAYQLTSTQGFRTFIKIIEPNKEIYYEPFQDQLIQRSFKCTQRMIINPESLSIQEDNRQLGLFFNVDYFNVVRDNYAGIVRILNIENRSSKKIKMEVLDGLPLIIPFGVDNFNLKNMRRLVESFVEVINLQHKAPYFKIRVKQQDSPRVMPVQDGNFYSGFLCNGSKAKLLFPVIDPQKIFENITDYSYPKAFINKTPFRPGGQQITENRLPCAMGSFAATINQGCSCTYCSIIGSASSVNKLNSLVPKICRSSYVLKKRAESKAIIEQLTQNNFVHSSSRAFDLYCRQNFLDNVLRGGFPLSLKGNSKSTTVHLYSRKHGDLERDYNDFRLSPTNYSQGNGNFRDVNQNRRNDLFFNPDVGSGNIEHFYNLIQLDGFNPLIVKPSSFRTKNKQKLNRILRKAVRKEDVDSILRFFESPYTPGQLMAYFSERNIKIKMDIPLFMAEVLAISEKHSQADYGHGFWSDHWSYNLDLLQNYLAVYPEKLRYILLENKSFTFFDNPYRVLPRDDKYVLWQGRAMQIDSVFYDRKKEDLIRKRSKDCNKVRTEYGRGKIYHTTLIHKILSIIINKIASLDFEGIGMEMESDKPNWYDALNGLPALFGSSISETIELKRLVLFTLDSIEQLGLKDAEKCTIAQETYNFMREIKKLLQAHRDSKGKQRDFAYWDKATFCKEKYRAKTYLGVKGTEVNVCTSELKRFLELALDKLNHGISKALTKSIDGVLPTYFINEVLAYKKLFIDGTKRPRLNSRGFECFRVKKFRQHPLPLFLEGPVHYLRIEKDIKKARALSRAIYNSGLYDRKLKMYKVNEFLSKQPMEIGRTKIFSRGWLENESIWMHMEYKYMLELLRSGLFTEFYRDFRNVFVPFMDPKVYGRSIIENSSFIASSVNPDTDIHGTGFVARLSGSTAEFIHILLLMTVGEKPFRIDENGRLVLTFNPVIPAWLFTKKEEEKQLWINNRKLKRKFAANTFSFMFLGNILVTYKNPLRKDTFGGDGVKPVSAKIKDVKGKISKIKGGLFDEDIALKVRARKIQSIEIELG